MYSSPKLGEVPVRAVGYITNLQYKPKVDNSEKKYSPRSRCSIGSIDYLVVVLLPLRLQFFCYCG